MSLAAMQLNADCVTVLIKVFKNSQLNMVWIFHFNDIIVNFCQKFSTANF